MGVNCLKAAKRDLWQHGATMVYRAALAQQLSGFPTFGWICT